MYKNVVEYIVKSLVDNPSSVIVFEKSDDLRLFFEIHVDPKDLGRLIGREGKTIRSIRALMASLDSRKDRDLFIEIAK